MKCKNHPDRMAQHICSSCNAPLCSDCAEESKQGVYTCFQCAMLQSVSAAGTGLTEKREKYTEKKAKKKKEWGPFRYFLTVASVLILVMWAVIIFGGQKPPQRTAAVLEKGKSDRVLLFLVDGSLKRYAHHEGNKFPEHLSDLTPKYLQISKAKISILNRLSYVRDADPDVGYRLSVAQPESGEMKVVLTANGLRYVQATGGESK